MKQGRLTLKLSVECKLQSKTTKTDDELFLRSTCQ